MPWTIRRTGKPKLHSPILIEGLPGIGNVGKIAADYLVENLKAKRIATFTSDELPNAVFVNERNLVELPSLTLLHYPRKKEDLLFLVGDTQPVDERSTYAFCYTLLTELQSLGCKQIITLGGIGLSSVPKEPNLYITGNDRKLVMDYAKAFHLEHKIYGVVGPIMGVTGLLVGLAKEKNIPAVSILAETLGHPMYLGLRSSKAILSMLSKRFSLTLDLSALDEDIEQIEEQEPSAGIPKSIKRLGKVRETSYIG